MSRKDRRKQPTHYTGQNQFYQGHAQPDAGTTFRFGTGYLREGYFTLRDGKPYLRPEVIDTLAIDIAKLLGNRLILGRRRMKFSQLREFFQELRSLEVHLDYSHDFETIKTELGKLKGQVAYQVGREAVPEEFKLFIDRNIELAMHDEQSFRQGFVQHFTSVLAYFAYYHRDRE